jgi:hypothetical protein
MLYLAATLAVLFTAWVFYAWMMAESFEIRWLRRSLAGLFIVLLTVMCLGGGVFLTRRLLVSSHRASLQQVSARLQARLENGRDSEVRKAIRFLAEPPAEGSGHSGDVLGRLNELQQALERADNDGVQLAIEPPARH